MELITIEQARAHCKTDGVDDDVLTLCANAAEKVCAALANRALFPTVAAMDAAVANVSTMMSAAFTTHAQALEAAASLDSDNYDIAAQTANARLAAARLQATRVIQGITADDAIIQAVLLTTGHYYKHREEGIIGDIKSVPLGAQRIMGWYRWVGSL